MRVLPFLLAACPLLLAFAAGTPAAAGPVVDATGRTVMVPDHPVRVLPAGPPAAILLLAVAPELMLGWPHPPSPEAAALLPDSAAALPAVPHLTGRADVADKILALRPDLILDYGDTSPRYTDLVRATQARTHIPTVLLDGALARTAQALRTLGTMLDRAPRAELLARLAEAILAAVPPAPAAGRRVVYLRGEEGLQPVQPGSLSGQVFEVLGWQLVAPPPGQPASIAQIAALDPALLVVGNPHAAQLIATSAEWRAVPAVAAHHVLAAPSVPFGWIEEPPSINRLLGVAWLSGGDPAPLAAMFGAAVYGRVPSAAQIATLRAGLAP